MQINQQEFVGVFWITYFTLFFRLFATHHVVCVVFSAVQGIVGQNGQKSMLACIL